MADPIKALFFPLSNLSLKDVLAAGDMRLALRVQSKKGRYAGSFSRDGAPVKLSLEKIDEHNFINSFLHRYYFGEMDKKYGATRSFLARLGVHNQSTINMDYADQTYKFKYLSEIDAKKIEVQLFYSPLSARMVVRGNKV